MGCSSCLGFDGEGGALGGPERLVIYDLFEAESLFRVYVWLNVNAELHLTCKFLVAKSLVGL